MDAARGHLHHAFAFDRGARLVEHHHVARACLRPVEAEGEDQVLPVAIRDRHREVVVDALVQLVQRREAVGRGEVHLGLGDGIDGARLQGMDGHGGTFGGA